jgi:hypothetical protein
MEGFLFIAYPIVAVAFLIYLLRFLSLGIRFFERELRRDDPQVSSARHKDGDPSSGV